MESELIVRLLRRDASAWGTFVDRYGGLVRRRVADVAETFGRRKDWSMVDDVTAEVFASLLARDAAALRSFRSQSSLSTYLAVIATRIARRVIGKSVMGEAGQSASLDQVSTTDRGPDPETAAMGREEKKQLLNLVDRLPTRQRDLVVAFYQEERSYAEISQQFDIPIGSIGTTLRRAEMKLREWIDDGSE